MTAMLTVQNVDLYYGAAQALRSVSLSASIGRVTCLLGRNGVGKTSLLRAICGLQPVAAGSITLEGTEISKMPAYERARRGVAIVPQGREIFPLLTVKENLTVCARAGRWRLDDAFELFPRLAERQGNLGFQLSGGEQQILEMAMVLLVEPSLLLLDEPSLGLSPRMQGDVFATVQKIGKLD